MSRACDLLHSVLLFLVASVEYTYLMQLEIAGLNEEDRMRDSSGGNIQTQYTANGLI